MSLRCFAPLDGTEGFITGGVKGAFQMNLGNMVVGTVTETGAAASKFHLGDRVYGYVPLRDVQTVHEDRLKPLPEGMTPQAAVCTDPALFGFTAVRDGNVRVGDRVAIMGLGAIGLMAVQAARMCSPEVLLVSDPIEKRRNLALKLGADKAFDPTSCDVGLMIKEMTTGGVDVAIEISGVYSALHDAIRAVHYSGLVVAVGFLHGDASRLRLGEEWHVNRITMRSSMPDWENPSRDHPMWSTERAKETVARLLQSGKLTTDGILDPIVPFNEAAEALKSILEHPEDSVKMGVEF
jgi:threonine dehydrogenase-like Zn-dependent dehydrogenase